MSAPASGASGTIIFTASFDENSPGWERYLGSSPGAKDNDNGNGEAVYAGATLTARITVDSQHRWATGSSMIIEIDPLVWSGDWTTLDNVAWKDGDTIQITIAGRDTLSLTGFSGAYLSGTRVG